MLDSLQHVQTALTAGRLVLYEDAAPVFVCRVCGEVARDQAPEYCPTCGAGHLTYQDFSATYYLEPEPIPELLAQLALTPDWLDHILSDVPPERTTQKVSGVEGEWSLIEAAGHLLDAQDLIAFRVSLFLTNESPNLSAKPVWEMTDAAKLSAHQIADRFRRSRETMLARLRSADPAYWARVGQHAEFGPVTLQQQAGYFVKHEQWHMAQITRIRDALVHHT